jgi:hypothetical protein
MGDRRAAWELAAQLSGSSRWTRESGDIARSTRPLLSYTSTSRGAVSGVGMRQNLSGDEVGPGAVKLVASHAETGAPTGQV